MAMNARSASQALRAFRPIAIRPAVIPACRSYATSSEPDLKTTFKEVLPAKRELLKKVKALGDKVIGEVKVENTLGGMR
ncbi:2-methylcitrate synthase, mitochondrial [Lachnellula subtilissima]|uniref:2-methylcitrate synthase, mitochondrial n=1 Tax=Lachnellula subtilissima TaxID=602034 RepID=A0A8H8RD07_9HELO|nr:2-methylcitrate synthase, mitochondrial [Lachnellula subtilissima]